MTNYDQIGIVATPYSREPKGALMMEGGIEPRPILNYRAHDAGEQPSYSLEVQHHGMYVVIWLEDEWDFTQESICDIDFTQAKVSNILQEIVPHQWDSARFSGNEHETLLAKLTRYTCVDFVNRVSAALNASGWIAMIEVLDEAVEALTLIRDEEQYKQLARRPEVLRRRIANLQSELEHVEAITIPR